MQDTQASEQHISTTQVESKRLLTEDSKFSQPAGRRERKQSLFALDPYRRIQWPLALSALMLFAAPIAMIVAGAFRTSPYEGGEWTFGELVRVFTNPSTYETLWSTVTIAITTVIISMAFAIFFATLASRTNTPLRSWITPVMAFVVAMPPLFYGISWALLGNQTYGLINSFINWIIHFEQGPINVESWWGLVIVSALRSVGFQYFLLLGAFLAMDRSLEESARISGSTPLHAFFFIQLPVLFPAISGVSILSLIIFLEAFDIPLMLGVPAGIYVLPTEAHAYLNSPAGPQFGAASALALILIGIMLLLVVVQYRLMRRRSFATVSGKGNNRERWDIGPWKAVTGSAIVLFTLFAAVLPVIQIVLASLSPFMGATTGFSVNNFLDIMQDRQLQSAYGTTALVATLGATVTVGLTTALLWAARLRKGAARSIIEVSQWLPAAVPGIILGLGVLWLFMAITPLRGLIGTPVSLIFALVITVVPLAGRAIEGGLAQIPLSLEESAWISGGNKITTVFRITGRLMLPSLINAWLLCFVVLSGTLAIPLLLSSTSGALVSVHIYKEFIAGNVTTAAAMFVILMAEILIVSCVLLGIRHLIERRRPKSKISGLLKPLDN